MSKVVERWDYFELELLCKESENPFLDTEFTTEFTINNRHVKVSGFYDGNGSYKARFMPDQEGIWHYITSSNLPPLDGKTGEFLCGKPSADNHGPVRVKNNIHFAYEDGLQYYPVGTTCYVWNLQDNELEERTLKTLKSAPFNKIRMCVFPKRYSFNNNEPPSYPFEGEITQEWDPELMDNYRSKEPPKFWNFNRFNPEYFKHLENRILDLRVQGIEADLILFHPYDFGAWGFDRMPGEVNDRLLKYLIARLGAIRNVWWSFANEYDLMLDRTVEDWDHYFQLVQENDPYNHLRSNHNCRKFYDHNKSWVTHCSIQHHQLDKVPTWITQYQKPVIIDECGYEGDIHMMWGDLSPEELVLRFWMGFTAGGYVGHGETYVNDREELWWSKGGELAGASVPRIAFLRQIIESMPEGGLMPMKTINLNAEDSITDLWEAHRKDVIKIIPEGPGNVVSAGYIRDEYILFYFGMHQPGSRNFNLPKGEYRIDLIDTWNMTIKTVEEHASGKVNIKMPIKKFIAVRIQKAK